MITWLSIDIWLIGLLSLAYLSALFFVAYWGENRSSDFWRKNQWIYGLSIGVSCTSWAFYGIVGQAAVTGEWLAHIYFGTIACFVLAWPMLLKMVRISKQQNITSIADFIASRYDRTPYIAALVTIIALLGTIPYIALQLRAISQSFDLVTSSYRSGINTTLLVTLVLALFGVLFGARHVVATKQNQGLLFAIAFSSLIKLLAITTIGIFVTFVAFDGFTDLISQFEQLPETNTQATSLYVSIAQIVLGFVTIFITPQLFHVIVIENKTEAELRKARWIYPGYLLLINIFVLPIAMAGLLTFPGGSVNADTFILTLPLSMQQQWLSIFVYIGGLAAATGMVIVAAIVLSTMFTTEIITPWLIKRRQVGEPDERQFSGVLLNARRISIVVMMLLALSFERIVSQQSHLSSIGLLSFVLLAQCAPAVIGAMYWRSATSNGAVAGLVTGTVIWVYSLLIPTLWPESNLVMNGPLNISWLKPTGLFGLDALDTSSHGVFVSLILNSLVFIFVSLNNQRTIGEKIQAEIFLKKQNLISRYQLTVEDLVQLLNRFVDANAAREMLKQASNYQRNDIAPDSLIDYTQKLLSSVMGSASTRLVMNAASDHSSSTVALEEVVNIVDEANELFRFNRELLQAGVENIEQGISVVDADMRLVAWNQRYIELLEYPENFIRAGMPVADLIRYNAKRNIIAGDDVEEMVRRRLEHMREGHNHYYQRVLPSGLVVEIRGQAMPGGGFVSTFSDITQHIETEKALQQANETLEQKVIERTKALSSAKAEAEAANKSKSRFLAAASHDLMQPFNALSLFSDMMRKKVSGTDAESLAQNIQESLATVESLISDLVEISKLESATLNADISVFNLDDIIRPLTNEFQVVCETKDILFRARSSDKLVRSDKRLIRRVIQNLLTNAVHYSPLTNSSLGARIFLGCKRVGNHIQIQVRDNGPGISKQHQQLIFKEFERLEQNREVPGLGLGLTISDRIAKLLNLKLDVRSEEGKGAIFYLDIPIVNSNEITSEDQISNSPLEKAKSVINFADLRVLIIDNDEMLLEALKQQLSQWSNHVYAVKSHSEWIVQTDISLIKPDVIIADYHLDDGENGIDVSRQICTDCQSVVPVIICSADASEWLREAVSEANFSFIRKPIKSLALRKLILKQLRTSSISER